MSKPTIKEENEYAKNVKDEVIYIGDAISGRKGYWCLGCKEEMDAVKKKTSIINLILDTLQKELTMKENVLLATKNTDINLQ